MLERARGGGVDNRKVHRRRLRGEGGLGFLQGWAPRRGAQTVSRAVQRHTERVCVREKETEREGDRERRRQRERQRATENDRERTNVKIERCGVTHCDSWKQCKREREREYREGRARQRAQRRRREREIDETVRERD